jgi:hypothetical protein
MSRIVAKCTQNVLSMSRAHSFAAICPECVSFRLVPSHFVCDAVTNRLRHSLIGRGARILNWPAMDNDQCKSRLDEWVARARRHLATRRLEKPLTKAGQLRALWPEIQIALDDGQTMRAIRGWLEDQGVVFTTNNLRKYISRIRQERRKTAAQRFLDAAMPPSGPNLAATPQNAWTGPPTPPLSPVSGAIVADRPPSPLAQAQEALAKRRFDIRKIHGDGDPSDRNLF